MDTREPISPPSEALRSLRAEMAKLDAPRGVEKELMQAFARQHPRRRWWQALTPRRRAVAGGLSGALAALLVFALLPHGSGPWRGSDPDARAARPIVTRDGGGLFIALETPERIEQEPAPRVVETEVSRSSLAPLGVPLTPENAGDTVKAEMLVAADGQPLALRLTAMN